MPKSKRAKVVHLSKVDKKGKELSQRLFANVRAAAERYRYVFVFAVDNMRNQYLKDVRADFADSRVFFGKTKVMAKALGADAASELLPNLARLAPHLAGNVGLLATDRDPDALRAHFAAYAPADFARAGVRATRDVVVPAGVVHSRAGDVARADDVPLPHSVEPTVRRWGMPTRLVRGAVVLDADYVVCRAGDALTSHQTALLKLFGIAMAEFRVALKAYYDKEAQSVTPVRSDTDMVDA